MKQFFQILRGLLLAFVLFEGLIFLGSKWSFLGTWIEHFAIVTAAIVFGCSLYITFIRKAKNNADDRNEYIVTMQPGSYGHIGNIFDRSKYENIERLPGGFLEGVHTYRTDTGSLIFTVRQNHPSTLILRTAIAALIVFVMLGPLSAVSYVDAINGTIGNSLAKIGFTNHPAAMSYLDVPPAHFPFFSKHTDASIELEEQDKPTKPIEPEKPEQEKQSLSERLHNTVNGWVTGASDWVAGLFDGGKYILPSQRRILTQNDVKDMDLSEIQRAINEMYARHGYDLSISADADYFAQQDWYHPDPSLSSGDIREQFTEIENENLDFLIACRNERSKQ